VGEGTYGQVYHALHIPSNTHCALKKIRIHNGNQGLPATAIREIKILKALRHHNMVTLLEVITSKGHEEMDEEDEREDDKRKRIAKETAASAKETAASANSANTANNNSANTNHKDVPPSESSQGNSQIINTQDDANVNVSRKPNKAPKPQHTGNLFLVLSYAPHDLTGLLDLSYKFTPVVIKHIFRQLLSVLEYIHGQSYIHRDLKCSNILILNDFTIKLADFGLARSVETNPWEKDSGQRGLTNKVITLWYRPPELLLGATSYTAAIDMWSAGCILAELIIGRPILPGKSEKEQIQFIIDLVGNENAQGIPNPAGIDLGKPRHNMIRERFNSRMSDDSIALVESLLDFDPDRRFTAAQALQSRYFRNDPEIPADLTQLGTIQLEGAGEGGNFHEFQTKKRRREAKALSEATVRKLMTEQGLSKEQAEKEAARAQMKFLGESALAVTEASQKAEREAETKLQDRLEKERKAKADEKARVDMLEQQKQQQEALKVAEELRQAAAEQQHHHHRQQQEHQKQKQQHHMSKIKETRTNIALQRARDSETEGARRTGWNAESTAGEQSWRAGAGAGGGGGGYNGGGRGGWQPGRQGGREEGRGNAGGSWARQDGRQGNDNPRYTNPDRSRYETNAHNQADGGRGEGGGGWQGRGRGGGGGGGGGGRGDGGRGWGGGRGRQEGGWKPKPNGGGGNYQQGSKSYGAYGPN
jgi:serine/threonine protein kinase